MPTFRGRPACTCLVAWLPVFEAELKRRGLIKNTIDVYQLIGGAKASGGTHATGGAFDIAQGGDAIAVARAMGADATWRRPLNWDGKGGTAHTHGVLRGCPHNGPARYQIAAVDAGYNGLGHLGHGAKDTGPRPLSKRTWQQGIAWALAKQAKPLPAPKAVPGKWGKFLHVTPYRINNSVRGLDLAVKQKKGAIDLDAHVTKDSVVVNTHWSQPMLKDGFTDPLGKINPRTFVWDLTFAEVSRLEHKDGSKIHSMSSMIRAAAARDLRVELEAKDSPGFAKVAVWERLRHVVEDAAADVQVKTLTSLKGYGPRLKAAHLAGFLTILLPRGTRRVSRSMWPWVDYVRGPVVWTGPTPKEKP